LTGKRKLHILILSSWYPTRDHPLGGVFVRQQAQALRKAGHQVGVISEPKLKSKLGLLQIRKPSQFSTQVDKLVEQGIPVYHSQTWGWFPALMHDANVKLLQGALERIYRRYVQEHGRPELIHGHSILYGGFLATWLGFKENLPSVVTEHATTVLRGAVPARKVKYLRRTLKQASRTLAVSPALAAKLRQILPQGEVEVLGNMVDVDFFRPASKALPGSPFHFASIAYLRPQKGMDVLLQAFRNAFDGSQVQLSIAGEGPERARLERQAIALGIEDQVNFLGALDRLEVRDLIRSSHVVVSASRVETFGITMIEAMACGKPVIATASGGPESFLSEQDGIVIPIENAPALASAMTEMKNNYIHYQPEEIRARCVNRFSETAIVTRLEEIYAELVRA
jgi:glycosyltransferase involved in cell wall biosynthesis